MALDILRRLIFLVTLCALSSASLAQSLTPDELYKPNVQSRLISAENPTGAPGKGGMTGNGRKGSPNILRIADQSTVNLADIAGPGAIRNMWMTFKDITPLKMRNVIFRIYWDGQQHPSVEAPIGDFFGFPFGEKVALNSQFFYSPEGRNFSSSFYMPFGKRAQITVTNDTGADIELFYYQIEYTAGDTLPETFPYFHAEFRRQPRTTLGKDYVALERHNVKGRFLGLSLSVIDLLYETKTWWGEGELKMYLDDDTDYPTINGTGIEDYVFSAWGFKTFAGSESGVTLFDGPRNALYRFHTKAPIYFHKNIKVAVQQLGNMINFDQNWIDATFGKFKALGMFSHSPYNPCYERVDDVSSVAYWYQFLPTEPLLPLPSRDLRSLSINNGS